jgi:putative hemolysin
MEEINKIVDIDSVIKNSNSKFFKSLPGFVIKLIKKIIHQDEINASIHRSRHLTGFPFINGILEDWNININVVGSENLPSSGRFVFASNHPLGGIDALAFFSIIHRFYPEVISPANELLYHIPNIRPLMLGVNVFGKNTKETATALNELFESDKQIFIFPAGEVSRRKKGIISDPVWQKSFITKAVQFKREVIPIHISGRNSNLFYIVANLRKFFAIKMYVETMLLPREMMRTKNTTVTVTFGKPIPYQSFSSDLTQPEWALKVKSIVYSLPDDKK